MLRYYSHRFVAGASLIFALSLQSVMAAKLDDVVAASDHWLVAQVDSQKRVDKLADDRQSLADDYRNTLRESDSLKLYIQQLKSQLQSQQDEM
ncbi:MAG: hypothetical protein JWR16_1006, partial [Nevskia sp.]|nr:hypothetical protein [Nevskia sp.]